MNYYREFENLELPIYHIKKEKLIKACFEQPFANNEDIVKADADAPDMEEAQETSNNDTE